MSQYSVAIATAVREEGLKKVLADVFRVAGIMKSDTAGQIIAHMNNGGVTKVVQQVEVKS